MEAPSTGLIVINNLIPAQNYSVYFAVQSAVFNSSLETILRTRIDFATKCCRSIKATPQSLYLAENRNYLNYLQVHVQPPPLHRELSLMLVLQSSHGGAKFSRDILVPSSHWVPPINSSDFIYLPAVPTVLYSSLNGLPSGNYSLSLLVTGQEASRYSIHPREIIFYVQNEFLRLPAPVLSSAVFTDDGSAVALRFDSPTNRGGISANDIFSCDRVFAFSCADLSRCQWTDEKTVAASVPNFLQCLVPGDSIRLTDSARVTAACPSFSCTNQKDWPVASTAIAVAAVKPSTIPVPTVVLNVPAVVSSLSTLDFDLTGSIPNCTRSWMNFTMSIHTFPIVSTTSLLSLLLGNYNASPLQLAPPLVIPAGVLQANVTYKFTVGLCNFLGACAKDVKEFRVIPTIVPILTIIGQNPIFITRSQTLSLASLVRFPATEFPFDASQIEFQWRVFRQSAVDSGDWSEDMTVSSVSRDPSRFLLGPSDLLADTKYQMVLTMVYAKGQSVSSSVRVVVERGKVVAMVKGSDQRNIRVKEILILDGSESYDEDSTQAGGLLFTWTCAQLSPVINENCSSLIDMAVFSRDQRSPLVELHAAETAVNSVLLITLLVTDGRKDRSSTAVVTVSILPAQYPTILLGSNVPDGKLIPSMSLKLSGQIVFPTAVAGNISWSVSSSLSLVNVSRTPLTETFSVLSAPRSQRTVFLSLSPNSLDSGRIYSFSLTCQLTNGITVSSSLSVMVNAPPSGGSFSVSPSSGQEVLVPFTLLCNDWWDSDLPIRYQFGYRLSLGGVVFMVLRPLSQLPFITSGLPAGLDALDNLLQTEAQIVDGLGANASATAAVRVYPAGSFNRSALVHLALNPAGLLTMDDRVRGSSIANSLLNRANCSLAPNCSQLHRQECSGLSHTCGSCLTGHFSAADGDGNEPCYQQLPAINTSSRKSCVFNCSGRGSCEYSSVVDGRKLSMCFEGDLRCEARCVCPDDYRWGQYCEVADDEIENNRRLRELVVESVATYVQHQDPSESSLRAWVSAVIAVAEVPAELSEQSIVSLLQLSSHILDTARIEGYSPTSSLTNFLTGLDSIATGWETQQDSSLAGRRALLASSASFSSRILSTLSNYSALRLEDMVLGQFPHQETKTSFRLHLERSSSARSSDESGGKNVTATLPLTSLESMIGVKQTKVTVPAGTMNGTGFGLISMVSGLFPQDTAFLSNSLSLLQPVSAVPCPSCRLAISMPSDNQGSGLLSPPQNISVSCPAHEVSNRTVSCPNGRNFSVPCRGRAETIVAHCPASYSQPTCTRVFLDGSPADGNPCTTVTYSSGDISCSCPVTNDVTASLSSGPLVVSYVAMLDAVEDEFTSTVLSAGRLDGNALERGWQAIVTVGSLLVAILLAIGGSYYADKTAKSKISAEDRAVAHVRMHSSLYQQKLAGVNLQRQSSSAASTNGPNEEESRELFVIAEEALPAILTGQSLGKKIWEEEKRFHKYLGIVFHFSLHFPRMLRVVSLATNVLIMLFIQSLTYNYTHDDDGQCQRSTTRAECLAEPSDYGTGGHRCVWTTSATTAGVSSDGDGSCSYLEPENSMDVVIFVAIFSALVSTPLAVMVDYLVNYVLSAPEENGQSLVGAGTGKDQKKQIAAVTPFGNLQKKSSDFMKIVPSGSSDPNLTTPRATSSSRVLSRLQSGLFRGRRETRRKLYDRQIEEDYEKLLLKLIQFRASSTDRQQIAELDSLWYLDAHGRPLPCWNDADHLVSSQSSSLLARCFYAVRSLFRKDQSISFALHEELLQLYSQLEREKAIFSLLRTETAKNKRLLFLFQKDLLPGITGEILDAKDQRENSIPSPVSRRAKMFSWLGLVALDVGMLFYVFLFAVSQDVHRQGAWGRSLGMYFLLDMLLISSGMVFVQHVLMPSLVSDEVVKMRKKVKETVSAYYRDLSRGDRSAKSTQQRYQLSSVPEEEDEDEEDVFPLHQAKADENKDKDRSKEKRATFNAAEFLFLSHRVAKLFPELQASQLILQFSSPWPKQSYRVVDMKKNYNYTVIALSQSAYIIAMFFLANLLSAPLALQDMVLGVVGVVVMGYTLLLHLKLFNIFPALVVVPGLSLVLLGGVGFFLYHSLGSRRTGQVTGADQGKAQARAIPVPVRSSPADQTTRRASLQQGLLLSSQLKASLATTPSVGGGEKWSSFESCHNGKDRVVVARSGEEKEAVVEPGDVAVRVAPVIPRISANSSDLSDVVGSDLGSSDFLLSEVSSDGNRSPVEASNKDKTELSLVTDSFLHIPEENGKDQAHHGHSSSSSAASSKSEGLEDDEELEKELFCSEEDWELSQGSQ